MSKQARADVLSVVRWWNSNVGNSPTHFLTGMRHAKERLSETPFVGVPVAVAGMLNLRRLALLQSRLCLPKTRDEDQREVQVVPDLDVATSRDRRAELSRLSPMI